MGYPCLQLRRDGARVCRTVHSLVMESFVGPCPQNKIVCHIDGNFWNCRLENLRYDTYRSNRKDMILDRRFRRGVFAALPPSEEPIPLDEARGEQWRDLVAYPGYQVSDLGRVRSFWRQGSSRMRDVPSVLKTAPGSHGYPQVGLKTPARTPVNRTVHSLVMEAFVGPRPPGQLVCHEDGNFWNCRLDNLRYDTAVSNRKDLVRDRRTGRGTYVSTKDF